MFCMYVCIYFRKSLYILMNYFNSLRLTSIIFNKETKLKRKFEELLKRKDFSEMKNVIIC